MKLIKYIKITLIVVSFLTISCRTSDNSTYINDKSVKSSNATYVNESSLLEIFSEKITFSSADSSSFSEINRKISTDRPLKAELSCNPSSISCSKIKKLLASHSVAVKHISLSKTEDDVILIYEKISHNDCYEQEYKNSASTKVINPKLGCAVASNVINMVTEKRQFVQPRLLSLPDAENSTKSLNRK